MKMRKDMAAESLVTIALIVLAVSQGVTARPKYTLTTIYNAPFTMRSDHTGEFIGYIPDLMARISEMLDFDYEFKHVNDSRYGSIGTNGEWNGMIGEVISKKVDIAAAPITVTSLRDRHIDFINAFMHTGLTAVVKVPRGAQVATPNHFSFLKPFTAEVFLLIALAYILVSLYLWAMNMYNPYEWAGHAYRLLASPAQVNYFSARGSFWYAMTIMGWQGFEKSPRSLASRTLSLFWMMFVALTMTFYTASLFSLVQSASLSRASALSLTPSTIEEIIASPDWDYGTIKGGSTMNYLKSGKGPMFDKFRKYAEQNPNSFTSGIEEGIRKVRSSDGKYAYFMEAASAMYAVNKKPCDLMMLSNFIKMRSYGLVVSQDFVEKDRLNQAILQLNENGELDGLERKWFFDSGECWDKDQDMFGRPKAKSSTNQKSFLIPEAQGVSLRMFSGPLVLLLIGFILATVFAGIEVFYFKYRGQHQPADTQKLEEDNSAI